MREILFRGKQKENDEWAYGFLVSHKHIGDWVTAYPVDPGTVGQFTGLTDKNGKKIFEGDIVRCCRTMCDEKGMVGHILYDDCCFSVKDRASLNQPAMDLCDDFEIIGNIHDNPELLRGNGDV